MKSEYLKSRRRSRMFRKQEIEYDFFMYSAQISENRRLHMWSYCLIYRKVLNIIVLHTYLNTYPKKRISLMLFVLKRILQYLSFLRQSCSR